MSEKPWSLQEKRTSGGVVYWEIRRDFPDWQNSMGPFYVRRDAEVCVIALNEEAERTRIAGFRVLTDSSLPPNIAEFRNGSGEVLARINYTLDHLHD